jgi:tetratricopeptide (TPR) repeat protein
MLLSKRDNLLYKKRSLKNAIDLYNKIIHEVNYLNALSNKGKCLIELDTNSEAIEIFKLVLDINPNFVYTLNGISDALNYLGNHNTLLIGVIRF